MAEALTLADLLPARLDGLADRAKEQLQKDGKAGGASLAWGYVAGQLGDALRSVLDIPALEMLAGAWSQAALLADHADPAKHPPGERSIVELGAHDVSQEFKPVVAVTIGDCPCAELEFTFAVTASFSGVKLALLDGCVTGGETGDAWASGQLSLQGVPLHKPAESKKLALPGTFAFDPPGIRIRPAALA